MMDAVELVLAALGAVFAAVAGFVLAGRRDAPGRRGRDEETERLERTVRDAQARALEAERGAMEARDVADRARELVVERRARLDAIEEDRDLADDFNRRRRDRDRD